MTHIVQRFARAGLDLRLASTPFTGNHDIFALDIRRERPHDVRSEHFLAWMGSDDNDVAVQSVDPSERQLVLFVREARRAFTETVPRHLAEIPGEKIGSGRWRMLLADRFLVSAQQIELRGTEVFVRRSTSTRGRHLLVGCDERQLFMCELPRPVTTVKQAHEVLRPAAVPKGTIRQGEWFFLAPKKVDLAKLEASLSGTLAVVRRKTSINSLIPRMGKPHVADEIVVVDGKVYARGAIRHPDHNTIWLRFWHQVHRNLEVDQNRSVLGGTWID